MDGATFLVTWDDTGNVGVVNLMKVELKEFTSNTGSDKGEHINSMFVKKTSFSLISACVGLSEVR